MGVSRSAYYEFKYHVPSDREIRRLLVTPLIADVHERSRGTYGMLRIRAALRIEHDMIVNKKLILSIMRELGIHGLPGPKKHKKNLVNAPTEEDLVQRNFSAEGPDQLWLTDITEHKTPWIPVVVATLSRMESGCYVTQTWSKSSLGR